MPLTRYQIRNEYGLADTELYEAANRDDPESLIEGVAMAGLVGVLRQLGDLAEFAAEIFHCLHEELMTTAARGYGLNIRLQQLEAEFPSVEKAVLSQPDRLLLFSDPGLDWHPYLRTEENMITRGNLPRCIMDSYEECRGPPRLFLLDKFDVAGEGSCLKRYSDPSLFKTRRVSELETSNIRTVKKSQKVKKKGSRGVDEETPEAGPTSHAKLHQLFSGEHVESGHRDPQFRVKLKRRQLNESPVNSSSGRSYMEKLVKSPPPDHETGPGSHSKLRFQTLRNDNANEARKLDNLRHAIEPEVKVSNVQEVLPTPSMANSNSGNNGKDLEMGPQLIADAGAEILLTPRRSTSKERPLTNLEVMPEICLEVGHSLDLTSTGDTYTDVPVYMEKEATETESVDKPNDLRRLGVGEHRTYLEAPESEMEVPAWIFDALHHSLEEEESKGLPTNFSSLSPESQLSKTEGSAETEDVSSVQPSVSKTSEGMGTPELEETLLNLSACENPQNLPRDTQSYLQLCSEKLKADEFGMNPSETSSVPELGRGAMLSTPPEAHQEYLLDQAPPEAEETMGAVLRTNYTDDCNTENVFDVETESVVSFSVLMDDQFPFPLDQEMEILKPESVTSEVDVSLSVAESNSKATPVTLVLDTVLPTQDVGAANGFENLSLDSIAHDDNIAEDSETNSESRCSMNTKTGDLISPSGVSSNDSSTPMPDADLKTGSKHFSASSSHIDPLVNPDLAKRPSDSEQEDRQTVSMISDDSDCKGMISKDNTDTLSYEASFASVADQDQTGLSNIALQTTMHRTGLRTSEFSDSICYQQENRLVTQEWNSPEYCPWSWNQGKDSPFGHVTVDPVTTSAESLPSHITAHGVCVDIHGLSPVKPAVGGSNDCVDSDTGSPRQTSHLLNSGNALPSGFTELESLRSADKKNSKSLDDRCSEPMLSMDEADENCSDIFPEAAPHCIVSLYQETQDGPFDTPPLPPLPPAQWWIGKLIDSIKTSQEPFPMVVSLEARGNSGACIHMDGCTLQATNEDTMLTETKNTEEARFSSGASVVAGESHSIHVDANEVTLHFGQSSDPQPATISGSQRGGNVEGKSETVQCWPEGATETLDAFKPSKIFPGLNLYENPLTEKLPGHKASLGNVLVAIDRSMLRKASERPRPPVGPRTNEQESLLEIIRSKSFNLRPANAPARPNVKAVPFTNLRIAAILEKANSLRQAMAGSDDDNDSDSWSDT